MTQTVFITGASSGIGKATAQRFQQAGWNVVATMRNPADGADLKGLANVLVQRLDVLDDASIETSVAAAIGAFGAIDVLVNNAGYGAYGLLEAFDSAKIRRQFDTNVIGVLMVTKAVLPLMRQRRSGTIVNLSSIGGKLTFPLGSLYHGTKFAIEGLSEALHYELEAVGLRVKIIEPGAVRTDFGGRSLDFTNDAALAEYQPLIGTVLESMGGMMQQAVDPSTIADVIFTASTDGVATLRYPAGADAEILLRSRKDLDDAAFIGGIKARMNLAA